MSKGPYGTVSAMDSVVDDLTRRIEDRYKFPGLLPIANTPHGKFAATQNWVHWPSLKEFLTPGASSVTSHDDAGSPQFPRR